MTLHVAPMTDAEAATIAAPTEESGLGALRTERGNLPLESVDATAKITGLIGRIELTQEFRNPHDVPLEATYVFPLPDRSAVTAMRMTADGRVVDAELKERGQAREEYDRAIAEGKRASIAEEERPDVFTMRVGNILPGERVSVALTLVGPLSYEDGEATFRLPLVVAPRYIPGKPLADAGVGDGYASDTDAVPDASRITPPVLLPGFPNPVRLSITVDIDPAGLSLGEVRSSLHAVVREGNHLSIQPGERANRDFVLRLEYGQADSATHSLTLTPDADGQEGTFRLTVLPPTSAAQPRPRDVVLLLDRSGSMMGWKMVAARRAAARIVDTLTAADRFAVLTFDHAVDHPSTLPKGLVDATDRHRFRAVEHLAKVDARGGTELLAPLTEALSLLNKDSGRDRVLVLVTDGQVGNEDQILAQSAKSIHGVRVHTVGIDQAVNAGFLGRLAAAGRGRCELVESEDRLDAAMERIHRRIGSPLITGLTLTSVGLSIVDDTVAPSRIPDLFPGAPLVLAGRFRGGGPGALTLTGLTADGGQWVARADGATVDSPALTAVWARAHLRDLEDRYVSRDRWAENGADTLEQRITTTSLRFGVLCRFTAWLAVDTRVITEGGEVHRVIQPVEPAAGWDMLADQAMMPMAPASASMARIAYTAAPESFAMPRMPLKARGLRRGRAGKAPASQPAPQPAPVAESRLGEEMRIDPDQLGELRRLCAEEATSLRAATEAPERERRELLADVGTRLDALVRHLGASFTDELAPLRRIVSELEADRPLGVPRDVFEDLWSRTLQVLDDLAVSAATPKRAREFWKR